VNAFTDQSIEIDSAFSSQVPQGTQRIDDPIRSRSVKQQLFKDCETFHQVDTKKLYKNYSNATKLTYCL